MIVKINNRIFEHFSEIVITTMLDSFASSISIKTRFNPDNEFHREIFRPLAFNDIELFDNENNLKFKGVIINNSFSSSSTRELQELSGYSLGGVLEDTTIPQSSYPLEKNNISLRELVTLLLRDFNLGFEVIDSVAREMDLEYKKTVAEPEESIKNFITNLAAQRNIVIGHNNAGNLVFFRLDTTAAPTMYINPTNAVSMSTGVNGQSMYSEITVIRQPSRTNPNLSPVDTVGNPLVTPNKVLTKVLTSGTETDTARAANNILAKHLKNIKFNVNFATNVNLEVGNVVELQNPEIYLYNRARLIVGTKTVSITPESTTSTVELLIPESFTGESPKNIFEI